jgi:hypothetical protein
MLLHVSDDVNGVRSARDYVEYPAQGSSPDYSLKCIAHVLQQIPQPLVQQGK